MTIDLAVLAAKRAAELGIGAIAIFPVTPQEKKRKTASMPWPRQISFAGDARAIRDATKDTIGIVCDVALDPYTTHGQDGI